MTIGIDKIGFATSQYVLKLQDLAEARGIDPEKLSKGLLLKELSIAPLTEDIVTLAASASDSILTEQERQEIDMVIVATESGIDQSKAAAVFVHGLLGIQPLLVVSRLKKPAMERQLPFIMPNCMWKILQSPRSWSLPVILPNTVLKHLENQLRALAVWLC